MKKRLLPVLLALFTVAAMLPTFAMADSSEMSGTEFLALQKDGVIDMTENVTLTTSAVINSDITINLNGFTLSRDVSSTNYLGVLLLDINAGSVTRAGPGTVTGGEYGSISYFSPKGIIDVAGSASLTIKDGAVISGGKIENNTTIGDFNTINFSGSGTLAIEGSKVIGLDYGNRDAGGAVYVGGTAKVVVTDSTITGGSSTSNAAGNALELRTSGEAAEITNSTLTGGASSQSRSGGDGLYISSDVSAVVNGGALTGGQGNSGGKGVGFFQIAGGISGDFPICVVPMMYQDLEWEDVPFWAYFCQISDSTTSYGSYSGAVPNEKITWGKLAPDTPKFIVESDATIVAPLIFAYVLGW